MIFVNMVSQPGSCFWGHRGAPSASLASPVAGDNTGDMPEHVFGYQASRTRPLEAARSPQ